MTDEEIFSTINSFKNGMNKIIQGWEIAAIGHIGKDAIEVHRKMIAELLDHLQRQDRHFAYVMGEKIEPQMHFGEAILLPAGGMS